jgi:2-oxo-4-hydroxy-4-carboxy-5-ureidoimidazoline decarboxylase
MPKTTLKKLNTSEKKPFVAICGPLFEYSPWIAQRTWSLRPFSNLQSLHKALVQTMNTASEAEKLKLIESHPDLASRWAGQARRTQESNSEQAAAGLTELTDEEVAAFDRFNRKYRAKFGFPFVICARKNKKDAILSAFPIRLKNSRKQEIQTALAEIAMIAKLRLLDAVSA